MYFNKNYKGYSPQWIDRIKRSIGHIAPHFTMKRQLDDYISKLYIPEAKRSAELVKDNFKLAREIVTWKEEVASKWNQIEILSVEINDGFVGTPSVGTGDTIYVKAVIDTKGLGDSIGVEVVKYREHNGQTDFAGAVPLEVVKRDGDIYTYEHKYELENVGTFRYSIRMYPKNDLLPHRQDFVYTRWF